MTATTLPVTADRPAARHAPLGRLLHAELRWIFRRPRTLIALGLTGLVPVAVAIGISLASGARDPSGLVAALVGNGLALPIVSLTFTLPLLLPLIGAMSAADAIAGEAAHGTLRGLLIAPVGRVRLFMVKATGVLAVCFTATLIIAVVGLVAGLIALGSGGLVTFSGTTLGLGAALGRLVLAVLWTTLQVFAVAAIALAISTRTEHPLVVMAATLAGLIVCTVLSALPALDWLQPYLITDSFRTVTGLLSDPVQTASLWEGVARGGCYLMIGLSLALAGTVTKDG